MFDQSQALVTDGRETWSRGCIQSGMRLEVKDVTAIEKGFADIIESFASLEDCWGNVGFEIRELVMIDCWERNASFVADEEDGENHGEDLIGEAEQIGLLIVCSGAG